jgi:outer membrane protein TolC
MSLTLLVLLAAGADATPPLDLDDLVRRALERNLEIEVTAAQVREAEALHQAAASTAYPQVDFRTIFGAPTAEARTEVVNDIDTITPPSLGGDLRFGTLGVTVRGNLTIAQPVYTFGKIANGKRATSHLVDAAEHQTDVTRATVVYNVHQAYWSLQLVRAFLASISDGQRTLGKVLDQIEELLDNDSDQVTENDRLRLTYALTTLGVRESQARIGGQQAQQALKLLVGWPADTPLPVVERSLYDALPPAPPPLGLQIDEAKRGRPDLKALRAVVEAQRDLIRFRRAGLFPDFFVGGILNFAYQSNATDQTNPFIFDPYNILDIGIGVGLVYELNVFTKLAELEQAQAELRTRQRQEILAAAAVELEVRDIHVQLTGGLEQLGRLRRANSAARGWLASNVLAYDVGVGDARELIDAFLAFAASEAELERVQFETVVQMANLARATGRWMAVGDGTP